MKKVRKKILVVDDHPITHRLLEKVLKSQGFDLISVFDGISAVFKAKEEHPDLILLDVMLPELGGHEVARRLKADPLTRDIPVVFVTNTLSKKEDKAQKEIIVDGVAYPAFAKPLYYLKLLSMIRKAIKQREKKEGG
ncbi:MAG: response regulator [Candidatus Omnitrophota bacterium]